MRCQLRDVLWCWCRCGSWRRERRAATAGRFGTTDKVFETAKMARDGDHVVWLGRNLVGLVFQKFCHDVVPDGSGSGDAGGKIRIHRRVIIVSDPNRDHVGRGVAKGPVIPFVVAGSGFNRHGFAGDDQARVWTKCTSACGIIT